MSERTKALLDRYRKQKEVENMNPSERSRRAAAVGQQLAAMSPDQRRVVFSKRIQAVGPERAQQELRVVAAHVQAANRAGHNREYDQVLRQSGVKTAEDQYNRGSQRPVGHGAWGW